MRNVKEMQNEYIQVHRWLKEKIQLTSVKYYSSTSLTIRVHLGANVFSNLAALVMEKAPQAILFLLLTAHLGISSKYH